MVKSVVLCPRPWPWCELNISLVVGCDGGPHYIFLGGYKNIPACTTRQARSMIYQNTFLNQSIIFIHTLWPRWGSNIMDRKRFCVRSQGTEKFHVCAHNFSVSLFSSSGTHWSHHLDGCQAIGIKSSFIFAFWALGFLLNLHGFF